MGAIFPNETSIYIVSAGVSGSSLATSDAVTTEITNWSTSGGERDVESVPVFGNAFIDKEMPRSQYEVSMDVVCSYDNAARWESLVMGGSIASSSAESSSESDLFRIFIQATDGTTYKSMAMDNVRAVIFDGEMSADEYWKGSITFKFSPTTSTGASNLKIAKAAVTNAFFN
jgi:hypothetical protein